MRDAQSLRLLRAFWRSVWWWLKNRRKGEVTAHAKNVLQGMNAIKRVSGLAESTVSPPRGQVYTHTIERQPVSRKISNYRYRCGLNFNAK